MNRLMLLSLLLLLATGSAYAQKKPEGKARAATKEQTKETKRESKASSLVAEQEGAVFSFVAEHHAELGDLLKHLKESKQAKQYERAIGDLYAVNAKLSSLRKSDTERYELDLKTWKLKSRIHLLSAKLTMGDNEDLKTELKRALSEQYDLRRESLTLDVKRLRDRELKLTKDLADLESRRDEQIEKQYQQLISANKTKPNGPKPNSKAKSEKPAKNAETTGR